MQATLVTATVVALALPLAAQEFHIPTNTPGTGTCNVIPFGQSVGSPTWSNQKYQCIALASDLGAAAGLVTGLGWAPCASGEFHFDTIEVVVDHFQGGVLTTTFANNLSPAAITVLSGTDYTWRTVAGQWNEIGLQQFFPYNGVDDLVVQVTVTGSSSAGNNGVHRDTRQRVYAVGWTGTPPAVGTSGAAALKFEVSMIMARVSLHGRGCPGINGIPDHTVAGTPQLGQNLSFDVANAEPNNVVFFASGVGNGAPYPIELTAVGLPGCFAYFGLVTLSAGLTSPGGSASFPVTVPNAPHLLGALIYSQFACLDNGPAQITTSNYARIFVGN